MAPSKILAHEIDARLEQRQRRAEGSRDRRRRRRHSVGRIGRLGRHAHPMAVLYGARRRPGKRSRPPGANRRPARASWRFGSNRRASLEIFRNCAATRTVNLPGIQAVDCETTRNRRARSASNSNGPKVDAADVGNERCDGKTRGNVTDAARANQENQNVSDGLRAKETESENIREVLLEYPGAPVSDVLRQKRREATVGGSAQLLPAEANTIFLDHVDDPAGPAVVGFTTLHLSPAMTNAQLAEAFSQSPTAVAFLQCDEPWNASSSFSSIAKIVCGQPGVPR